MHEFSRRTARGVAPASAGIPGGLEIAEFGFMPVLVMPESTIRDTGAQDDDMTLVLRGANLIDVARATWDQISVVLEVPELHFVEISKDRKVYIGERGQNRIQVFTTDGKWLQDIMVSPNTPARGCGGVASVKGSPCGPTRAATSTRAKSIPGSASRSSRRSWPAADKRSAALGAVETGRVH